MFCRNKFRLILFIIAESMQARLLKFSSSIISCLYESSLESSMMTFLSMSEPLRFTLSDSCFKVSLQWFKYLIKAASLSKCRPDKSYSPSFCFLA